MLTSIASCSDVLAAYFITLLNKESRYTKSSESGEMDYCDWKKASLMNL